MERIVYNIAFLKQKNVKLKALKTLQNITGIVNMKELEDMNEGWEKSFGATRKRKMNLCVSWNKWVDKASNNEYVKGYILIQLSNNRNVRQRDMFQSMYNRILFYISFVLIVIVIWIF